MPAPGERFGKLTAVRAEEIKPHQEREWLFRCDCGAELPRKPSSVRSSVRRLGWASCGACFQAAGGWPAIVTHPDAVARTASRRP